MGTVFRLLNHRGISTRRIAAAVDIAQGRLYEYMNGKSRVEKLALFEQIADAFHIPGYLLGLTPRSWEQQSTELRRTDRERLAADAAESAQFARFLTARNVDATVIHQLDSDVARLARQFVSHPLEELFADIRDLRREVFSLLHGRQLPKETLDLYVVAGRLCGLSAHVCLDVGDYSSAATHARAAWVCAAAADHNGLKGWVRAVESLIAYWDGDPLRAVQLARVGQQHMSPGSIRVRLASLEARALSAVGDTKETTRALRAAEDARGAVSGEDEVSGLFAFPIAKQHAYAATTRLALGGRRNILLAVESAHQAVAEYSKVEDDDQSTGDLRAAHLDIARGHMLEGELEGVESALGCVLDTPRAGLSASIVKRLTALHRDLGAHQYRGSSQAIRLRARIKDAGASGLGLPAAYPRSR
ncbi:helix-turn-helix domain-containing protein [Streptomyces sp. PR69]|uniref:helix-turn-helix domain-containing protein n=1 Tax=Streptomyces sp. PR69 TaxID=2984950 RepID=UPI0022649582|nr:helix-turn-helix transcriptional regulator [Streptomyces sp. PR69]